MNFLDPTIVQAIRDVGTIGLLVIALVGAYRRWYVFKGEFQDERDDKNEWKAIAMRAIGTAEKAANVVEKVVGP